MLLTQPDSDPRLTKAVPSSRNLVSLIDCPRATICEPRIKNSDFGNRLSSSSLTLSSTLRFRRFDSIFFVLSFNLSRQEVSVESNDWLGLWCKWNKKEQWTMDIKRNRRPYISASATVLYVPYSQLSWCTQKFGWPETHFEPTDATAPHKLKKRFELWLEVCTSEPGNVRSPYV